MRIAVIAVLLLTMSLQVQAGTVRVITDRTESHLKPIFKLFEKNTGIKVEALYVDKGLMARLETRPTEADIVISSTADHLEVARKKGWLQSFNDKSVAGINKSFVDPDNMYVITSYRPRGLFISKDDVEMDEITSYKDITKPEYKGKVLIRSGYHSYNMSLFCQMAEKEGLEKTKAFITGLKANLARTPTANDRGQVQAIYEDKGTISVGNSYYMGIMRSRDDQKAWADATAVLFPNQDTSGTYVMSAAAGLTKANRNVEEAEQLLAYLLSDFSQYYFASTLHVWAVKEGIPTSELNKSLGQGQPGITDGDFKAAFVSIRDIDKHREAVIEILNEVDFDNKK